MERYIDVNMTVDFSNWTGDFPHALMEAYEKCLYNGYMSTITINYFIKITRGKIYFIKITQGKDLFDNYEKCLYNGYMSTITINYFIKITRGKDFIG